MTTLETLNRWLLEAHENEHLEFKEAKQQYDTTKLMRYCVALANEGGGHLVLGVSDKRPRQVVGTQAFQNRGDVTARILEALRMRVDVQELQHPDGRDGVLERLAQERLIARQTDGWSISNLAAILLAKRLDAFSPELARKAARVVIYEGANKLSTRYDEPQPQGYAVGFEKLVDFVHSSAPRNHFVEQALRDEVKRRCSSCRRRISAPATRARQRCFSRTRALPT